MIARSAPTDSIVSYYFCNRTARSDIITILQGLATLAIDAYMLWTAELCNYNQFDVMTQALMGYVQVGKALNSLILIEHICRCHNVQVKTSKYGTHQNIR